MALARSASGKPRRAAHFLNSPELIHSPPNTAIITALLDRGVEVDVFAPRLAKGTDYGGAVRTAPVAYSWRWLANNAWRHRWSSYQIFSGTSEDPIAIVGVLAALHRRPSFILADEIKSDFYYGDRPESWKRLCRWANRRARFNIVNDESRLDLLRKYAELPDDARLIVYPGCYHTPPQPPADFRQQLRRQWGIPEQALVVGASGNFNLDLGADLLLEAMAEDRGIYAVIQPVGYRPFEGYLLRYLQSGLNLYVENERLSWHDSWRSAVGFDIGMAFYRHQGSQFQHMGISSNRLCMFLAMGVPVIVNRQPSFEFLERFGCGLMVSDASEFRQAIAQMRRQLEPMRQACRTCFEEYIMPPGRYETLAQAIAELFGPSLV